MRNLRTRRCLSLDILCYIDNVIKESWKLPCAIFIRDDGCNWDYISQQDSPVLQTIAEQGGKGNATMQCISLNLYEANELESNNDMSSNHIDTDPTKEV